LRIVLASSIVISTCPCSLWLYCSISTNNTNNGIISKDSDGMYGVRYNHFIPMTVKAVQEQQVLIEKLQKDNEQLKAMNEAILKRLVALEKKNN